MNQKSNFIKSGHYGHKLIMGGVIVMVVTLYGLVFWNVRHTTSALRGTETLFIAQESSLISVIKQVNADYKEDLQTSLNCRPFAECSKLEEAMRIARTYPTRFSSNLAYLTNISSRKETFVSNLLPSILAHNEKVQSEREYLLILKKIKDTGKKLNFEQMQRLNNLALKYKLRRVTIAELLKRVDVIPPSLALGQAVVETGWGGSLAAQRFNSPFGMMKSRTRVFSYNSLQESVSHYIHNLNTHEAYAPMRAIRAKLRNTGEQLCPLKLAEGLLRYSELGRTYTGRVKTIIKSFGFQQYDKARLTSFYQQS
jgi:Bax protein